MAGIVPVTCMSHSLTKQESTFLLSLIRFLYHHSRSNSVPTIFIAFENEIPNKRVRYDRGVDTAGNSIVTLTNQANIGPSIGRLGNVLRLSGIDAGAVVGKFESHPLK